MVTRTIAINGHMSKTLDQTTVQTPSLQRSVLYGSRREVEKCLCNHNTKELDEHSVFVITTLEMTVPPQCAQGDETLAA